MYERDVGGKRFLIVFLLSGIVSSVSVLLVSEDVISAGASAGLLGMGAAYFLDNPALTTKDYIIGIVITPFPSFKFSISSQVK